MITFVIKYINRGVKMIYCVEDDKNIQEMIIYSLKSVGFSAKGFDDSSNLYNEIEKEIPKLILLDIMLPNEDGLSILKKIKNNAKYKDIPVIMLTAKSTEFDKVKGLDLGADDYVSKPFGVMELIARIKAVLRRNSSSNNSNSIKFKNIEIITDKHLVKVNDSEVKLTLKEYELLKELMLHSGIVLTREQLLEKIWGYDYYGETRTVDVHIRTLRSKIDNASEYIQTIRGVGYKFSN
jgi:two-component system alkaline phosphatase synthesis response regulator PhoP